METKTTEQKAKAYDEAIEKIKYVMEHGVQPAFNKEDLYGIFPELAQSEDEKIRKKIIEYIKTGTYHKDWIDWLEKQKSVEEIVERCKNSWYNEGKIAGMAEGLTDEEKYQQGWHDALEKQNEQNSAWSEEDEKNLKRAIWKVENPILNIVKDTMLSEWLKSIKGRVQPQPKQEWSEEDERLCLCLIEEQKEALNNVKNDKYGHSEIISDLKEMYNERISWLKSLKQRIGG